MKSIQYLNINTLSIIISIIIVSRGIELSGVFNKVIIKFYKRSHKSIVNLIIWILILTELTAALIMNDTALFIYIPLVITLARIYGLNSEDLVILVTIAANIGSALTPIGNPQNIIIWKHFHINFYKFILTMVPLTFIGSILLILISYIIFRNLQIRRKIILPNIKLDKKLLYISIISLIIDVVLAEYELGVYTIVLTIIIFLIIKRDILFRLDYPLIVIFAFMFIDFREISVLLTRMNIIPVLNSGFEIMIISIILSQFISNVPATITLLNHVNSWVAFALGVNIGGVGFILGSMANIITIRLSKVNLRKFHLYTIPYITILSVIFLYIIVAFNI